MATTTKSQITSAARWLAGARSAPERLVEMLLSEAPFCGDHYGVDKGVPVGKRRITYYFYPAVDDTTTFEVIVNWAGFEDGPAVLTRDPEEVASAKEVLGIDPGATSINGIADLETLYKIKGLGARLQEYCALNHVVSGNTARAQSRWALDLDAGRMRLADVVKAFPEFPVQSASYATSAMPSLDYLGFSVARVRFSSSDDALLIFPQGQEDKIARRWARLVSGNSTSA